MISLAFLLQDLTVQSISLYPKDAAEEARRIACATDEASW